MKAIARRINNAPKAAIGLLLVLLSGLPLPGLALESASETAVKIGFLYNFFKFIEWPAEAVDEDALHLCALGEPEIVAGLDLLRNKSVDGKTLKVTADPSPAELRHCQILYIGKQANIADYLRAVKDQSVVTVSDQNSFIDRGGVIGFVLVENRLAFEINNDVANRNRLHINAQLLKLAQRVAMEK